jgi:hypothetical protein
MSRLTLDLEGERPHALHALVHAPGHPAAATHTRAKERRYHQNTAA